MIFAYDQQGVIMSDSPMWKKCRWNVLLLCFHAKKLRRKMHKNWTQLLVAGPITLHDNARPHIADVVTKNRDCGWDVLPHAPNSPDMSPPDFYLFPKLKELMRGTFFFSGKLPTDVTRAIRHMNKSGVLSRIIMLPINWNSVIEKQGDYIEGLWTDNLKEIVLVKKYIVCITFEMVNLNTYRRI